MGVRRPDFDGGRWRAGGPAALALSWNLSTVSAERYVADDERFPVTYATCQTFLVAL